MFLKYLQESRNIRFCIKKRQGYQVLLAEFMRQKTSCIVASAFRQKFLFRRRENSIVVKKYETPGKVSKNALAKNVIDEQQQKYY